MKQLSAPTSMLEREPMLRLASTEFVSPVSPSKVMLPVLKIASVCERIGPPLIQDHSLQQQIPAWQLVPELASRLRPRQSLPALTGSSRCLPTRQHDH